MRHTLPMLALFCGLGACGNYDSIVIIDDKAPTPAVEDDRIAEAFKTVPIEERFFYDIYYSGFFSEGEIDLAVLREYCRPGKLLYVAEAPVPGSGMLTAEMYIPREIAIRCSKPTAQ